MARPPETGDVIADRYELEELVGTGGIGTFACYVAAACGARDIALGTVLFADPCAPARVRAELAAACADAGVATPDDARSLAKSPETQRKVHA